MSTVTPVNHADCSATSYTQGQKGVTYYKSTSNPYLNPKGQANDSWTVTWTGTRPRCYNNSPSVCNVSFDVLINSNTAANDVQVNYNLNNKSQLGPIYHSRIQGHDITTIVDISQYLNSYNDVGVNTLTFSNQSTVGVWINNLRIMREYGMCYLPLDANNSCASGLSGCSPGTTYAATGSLDAGRNDCPCNYQARGGLSVTGFGSYRGAGSLVPYGSTLTWIFKNPGYHTGQTPNYVGPAVCFFNLNNVDIKATSPDNDVRFQFDLNGHSIASMYNSRVSGHTSGAGIDLVKFTYYNDAPNATNTLQLSNKTPSTTLVLRDGEDVGQAGRINIYRVYNVTKL
ncbi:MAG: hypothetical protein FWG55_00185 [Candidatus Bathyarchaeota archaeon]|nr:hypothetical protein [Candidatus Termiticorpusculum sp.]